MLVPYSLPRGTRCASYLRPGIRLPCDEHPHEAPRPSLGSGRGQAPTRLVEQDEKRRALEWLIPRTPLQSPR